MKEIINQKWGVAFGGGGAKGSAHIGFVKYFQKSKLEPHAISGNSIGSFIAAMYAFKFSHKEIREAFLELEPFKITFLRPTAFGIMKNSSLYNVLLKHFEKGVCIEDSEIPLGIHTTDIVTGKPNPLFKGDLIKAIISSCCVPGIYIPIVQEEKILVDGGLTENVPISLLKTLGAKKTIALDLNGQSTYSRPKNVMDVMTNSFDIAIDHTTRTQLAKASKVFSLDLTMYSRFVIQDVDEIIDRAYKLCSDSFK